MSDEKNDSSEQPNFQVRMVASEHTPVVYSDFSYINHTQNDFSLYFFLVNPPIGRALNKDEVIDMPCKVRIILTPAHMDIFARTVMDNFRLWQQSMAQMAMAQMAQANDKTHKEGE